MSERKGDYRNVYHNSAAKLGGGNVSVLGGVSETGEGSVHIMPWAVGFSVALIVPPEDAVALANALLEAAAAIRTAGWADPVKADVKSYDRFAVGTE